MPKQVALFKVLIASPSDVAALRDVARDAVMNWNSELEDVFQAVLLPRMWEYDVAPELGVRPQEIVNRQIVDEADMLVAIFYSRLGTPTGKAESGTAEEIARFLNSNRPVSVYFYDAALPNDVDSQQLERLRDHRRDWEKQGVVASFREPPDLSPKLQLFLTRTVSDLTKTPNARQAVDSRPSGGLPQTSLELFFRREFPMWWPDQAWYRVGVRNKGRVVAENVVVTMGLIEPNPLPLNVLPAQLGKKDGGTFDCRINPGGDAYFDVVRRWPDTPDLLQLWTVPAMGQEFRLDPTVEYRTRIGVTAANAEQCGPLTFVLRQPRGEELSFELVTDESSD